MKESKLNPVDLEQQEQVVGGHIGDSEGPNWEDPSLHGASAGGDYCP